MIANEPGSSSSRFESPGRTWYAGEFWGRGPGDTNHSLMHMPVVPRDEFRGRTGHGDWADSLVELDHDFGVLLDLLDELVIRDDTLVVFAGDNGPEEVVLWRGSPGYADDQDAGDAARSTHRHANVQRPERAWQSCTPPHGRCSDETP